MRPAADMKGMPPDGSTGFMLRGLIEGGALHSAYQPIVDIGSLAVVGYEALVRGPENSPLASPADLFGAARRSGQLVELDRACREAAVQGAWSSGMGGGAALFVNVEPEAVNGELFSDVALDEIRASRLRVFIEVTERALTARPAELLATIERVRPAGVGVALDDVGADDRSLALMPFLRPDVVKLDLRLIRDAATAKVARIVNAISAEAERTGALVLAEGIETDAHLFRAQAIGADLGQGWLFGRPGPLPVPVPEPMDAHIPVVHGTPPPPGRSTPFTLVSERRPVRRGDKKLLLRLSRQLEAHAAEIGHEAVLLATFQHNRFLTETQAAAYSELAECVAFVGVFGDEVAEHPMAGVRGANLHGRTDLANEWNVLVIGPHFAGGFVARDLGDEGPDEARRFDFAMTFDRELVSAASAILMHQVSPSADVLV
jgi:EAL domain-containing protein (putative c-di-GMP-specific phosphodiesterase class I)